MKCYDLKISRAFEFITFFCIFLLHRFCFTKYLIKNIRLRSLLSKYPCLEFGPETPQETQFYESKLQLLVEQSFRLAKLTIRQAKSTHWRKERILRTTSSKKAHAFLTIFNNRAKYDETQYLTVFFERKKLKREPLDYGNEKEPNAKKKFCQVTKLKVYDIGLVCKHG